MKKNKKKPYILYEKKKGFDFYDTENFYNIRLSHFIAQIQASGVMGVNT